MHHDGKGTDSTSHDAFGNGACEEGAEGGDASIMANLAKFSAKILFLHFRFVTWHRQSQLNNGGGRQRLRDGGYDEAAEREDISIAANMEDFFVYIMFLPFHVFIGFGNRNERQGGTYCHGRVSAVVDGRGVAG